MDPEVEKCQSIEEIIRWIGRKKDDLPNEQNQILDHIKDKSVQVDAIDITGIDEASLKKRTEYLVTVSDIYEKIITDLNKNKDIKELNLNKVKKLVSDIKFRYLNSFDVKEDSITKYYDAFHDYIENEKQSKRK